MAEILSKQYESVFSRPRQNPNQRKFEFQERDCNILTDIEITKDALIAAMKSIKSSSAPGPDELPTALYHRFAEELAIPLQLIWRRSLDTGLMPE